MATTLYAQSTGNLSAISWNTAANGSGSTQSPTAADTLVANGYNITLGASYSFVQLKQTSNGGTFIPASGTTLTLTDSTTGLVSGSSATPPVVTHSGSGVANIVGLLVGTTYTSPLIGVTGSGTLNVTTNSLFGQAAYVTGVLSISGSGCTVNIAAGQVVGGTNGPAISCASSAILTVTGPQTAGTFAAIQNSGAATITLNGTSTASAAANAVSNTNANAIVKASGPMINNGRRMAIYSQILQIGSASTYMGAVDYNLNARNLYTADTVGGNPAIANVRHGTVYGPSNELTGTCHVPGAASVLSGVPVDATVGTAALAAADIRAALGMSSANLDTQLSAIPTAAAIRTEIDANSTKLDIAVSTRLAPAGTLATVTNLTNAPDVPTETEIAAAVWSYVTRTITSGGITAQQVWEYVSALLPDGAEALLAGIAARLAEQVPTGPVIVVPAPGAGQTTAWVMCVDEAGAAAAGVEIYVQIAATAAAGAYSMATQILLSDADGLAAGPIPRGTEHRFRVRRGTSGAWVPFAGVDATTLALPAIIGAP